ncbi:MAG: YicC/YloC family endoribonuclease [Candidatus Omnitrophota bacterium]
MIKSMTGFGKGETTSPFGAVKAEIRTINHKFLDAFIKLPEGLSVFEEKVRTLVQRRVKRGKANLNITVDETSGASIKIVIDEKLAKSYHKQLLLLKKELGLEGGIKIEQIMALPGLIKHEAKGIDPQKAWPYVEKAINSACGSLDRSRLKEGAVIYKDLKKRTGSIKKAVAVIDNRSSINIQLYKKRLSKTIKKLSGSTMSFDKNRLEQEVALFAKNCDVTEEITRIRGHLKNVSDTLSQNGEAGKKLDFIAQELHREVNTIGAKASDLKISQKVIQIKSEVEKLREQAKNIE